MAKGKERKTPQGNRDTKKDNLYRINPSIQEDVYAAQPDEEKFEPLHKEWMEYQGKAIHPTKGVEVSKSELREEELVEIVNREVEDLKKRLGKEGVLDVAKSEGAIFEIAKKTYLQQQGISDESAVDEKELINNVRGFISSIAQQVTGESDMTYERAIATIMSAKDPIYGRGDDRSRILDQIIQQYAQLTHVSGDEETKGQSARRLAHIESKLSDLYHRGEWITRHGKILQEHGYEGARFGPNAQPRQIMEKTSELLGTGETNVKEAYINVKLPVKRKKAVYDRAA